jgi:AcrR family transcriptional regulator
MRARITEAALELFVRQGYAETTIDQIAEAAAVGRRTIFRHFTTKAGMLFDHLAVRRDFAVYRLLERPLSEPPLVSLHAVLRELCEQGYDRRLLGQIRAVLAIEPRVATEELSAGVRAFEDSVMAALQSRQGAGHSPVELQALTEMAERWFVTAVRVYFKHGDRSLLEYFDEVVSACVQSCSRDLAALVSCPMIIPVSKGGMDE